MTHPKGALTFSVNTQTFNSRIKMLFRTFAGDTSAGYPSDGGSLAGMPIPEDDQVVFIILMIDPGISVHGVGLVIVT